MKIMNKIPLETLLDKYLTGNLSEEERRLLLKMMDEPGQRKKLEEIIDEELLAHAYEGEENEKMLSLIQEGIQKKISVKEKPSGKIVFILRRLAVAAVVIGLLVTTTYLWYTSNEVAHKRPGANQKAIVITEITAGRNRALLELADGSDIVLDSSGTGILAKQGGATIVKIRDGEIAYRPDKNSPEVLFNTITTPMGGQYQLVLTDGTKVWLNAASSLRFPASFTGNERNVILTGEGYFEVAKHASRPFHVQVNNMNVEVLGTHFNINAYADEPIVRTALLEGSVKVSMAGQVGLLKPGQQAVVNKIGEIKVQPADVNAAIAWKNGFFEFSSADMQTVLRQAARWYDVEFEYKANIKDPFSGQIPRNINLSQFLQILELTDKARVEIRGKKIIINP